MVDNSEAETEPGSYMSSLLTYIQDVMLTYCILLHISVHLSILPEIVLLTLSIHWSSLFLNRLQIFYHERKLLSIARDQNKWLLFVYNDVAATEVMMMFVSAQS